MSSLDIQTIITLASLLLNVKEVHGWFDSRSIQQKALVLWHLYSTMSDVLLATLWWCMRADGSVNKPHSSELGHSVGFSEWTTGGYAYLFWAVLGLKALTQFPAATNTRRQQLVYLSYCYAITVAAHFPFIMCVLTEVKYNGWIVAIGVLATVVCYVIYLLSEVTFRLQAPDAFSEAHPELITTLRFCVEWFYLMIMVLPFSNWQLQLPDYFLLGYAVRVLLWLAYTAVMSKASSVLEEVEWMMFRPVKGGRPGEYEEVGQVQERKGQMPLMGGPTGSSDGGEDDSSGSSSSEDDDGSGEDIAEAEKKVKKAKKKSKRAVKVLAKGVARLAQQNSARSVSEARDDDGGDEEEDESGEKEEGGGGQRQRVATEKEKGRVARANVQAVKDAAVGGDGQHQLLDVDGSNAVKARLNGEDVILIKKPKASAAGASSASPGAAGVAGGMHALDIHDVTASNKSEKKGR